MVEIGGLYGKITKLVDEDGNVWKVGKDNIKEIEIHGRSCHPNNCVDKHFVNIKMRDGSYKELYGFMKSIKVEFE
jgi:hypothetical protein